ncbi:hypothetical protein [Priestia taiwanensis]|uniref:Uncharacterized protein n=1 Tax=Priestia taiwanensis TaxID=1347902 RepID=A0A917AQM2_9BACI|nr:hypothetical protein [Priestia taiwanensis]MBM7362989.1 hypothetical protein [Priestia taiwanensis]GGE66742.1 hypothetical protein GCM10007140_16120 [Priestia taiwanensis]
MKSVQDALYNWLTIKVVADARPDDKAAQETYELFDSILKEEHNIHEVEIEVNEEMYLVTYVKGEERKNTRFPAELIDCYLDSMHREPEKFVNYE